MIGAETLYNIKNEVFLTVSANLLKFTKKGFRGKYHFCEVQLVKIKTWSLEWKLPTDH